jgi:Tol biopolymer transport system component/DNA-binding winged helix-turn-helix (wHTH) protein
VGVSTSSRPRLVRFGVFELDVRSGELRKSGARVPLQDQPLKLLECLLEHPGELVTRDELRARLWPGDTFVDFEQGVNAAVKRLREALMDSADAPRFIQTLPRRGYRFVAPVERNGSTSAADAALSASAVPSASAALAESDAPAAPVAAHAAPAFVKTGRPRATVGVGIAAILIALIAAAGWAFLVRRSPPGTTAPVPSVSSPRLVPLTRLNGYEHQPTFSPDGRQVAFAWDGGADNSDIYVTLVGSSEVRRLTTDAGRDFAPQWSPDGRHIAYVRAASRMSQRIRVMSALGGSDRELSDFAVWAPIAWSPDGRFIAAGRAGDASEIGRAHAIHLIPLVAGEPRPLTRPAVDMNDWSPAFSPDGRRLAYASCRDLAYRSMCHVKVVDLDAAFAPIGPPRRLTPEIVWTIDGLTWTRDSRSIIYSARQGSLMHLWRADAAAAHPPERIEMAGPGVAFPAVAPTGDRLVYAHATEDMDVYRFDPPGPPRPIARSSTRDTLANFSPDGRRIAYCSGRSSDAFEVWVAGLDGSPPERLTHGPGQWQCSPAWSPDGARIAFDSLAADGSWHVWTIDANGGVPRQITTDAGNQFRPSWSRDGQWIYFVWVRDHDRDVWRMRVTGGPAERVTHGGSNSVAARESMDGTGVWYKREQGDGPLLFQPLAGGAARPVIPCVRGPRFTVGREGVYYMPCARNLEAEHEAPVRVFDVTTREERLFGLLNDASWPAVGQTIGCFAISPDGRTLLFCGLASREADLMLIEHFR